MGKVLKRIMFIVHWPVTHHPHRPTKPTHFTFWPSESRTVVQRLVCVFISNESSNWLHVRGGCVQWQGWGKVVGKAPRGGWVLANEIPARTPSGGNLLNLKTENNYFCKVQLIRYDKLWYDYNCDHNVNTNIYVIMWIIYNAWTGGIRQEIR